MVIEPTTRNDSDTIESGDGSLSEEGGEDISDDTTDGVGGEDIETIVVVEEELELGGEIADGSGHETEENGSGWMVIVNKMMKYIFVRITHENRRNRILV